MEIREHAVKVLVVVLSRARRTIQFVFTSSRREGKIRMSNRASTRASAEVNANFETVGWH